MTECPLTEQQLEIVRWLSFGKTYSEAAEFTGISMKAAQRRVERAWVSTGTRDKTGLVAMALRKGWIN